MLCLRRTSFPFTSVGCFPRAWLEPPRKKTTSCGVSRLMGLTIVRPPKCICYSRWSQPTYVQRNLNRLVTSERLNNFILYRSGFQSYYCFMKLIHLFYYLVLHHISIIICKIPFIHKYYIDNSWDNLYIDSSILFFIFKIRFISWAVSSLLVKPTILP